MFHHNQYFRRYCFDLPCNQRVRFSFIIIDLGATIEQKYRKGLLEFLNPQDFL